MILYVVISDFYPSTMQLLSLFPINCSIVYGHGTSLSSMNVWRAYTDVILHNHLSQYHLLLLIIDLFNNPLHHLRLS